MLILLTHRRCWRLHSVYRENLPYTTPGSVNLLMVGNENVFFWDRSRESVPSYLLTALSQTPYLVGRGACYPFPKNLTPSLCPLGLACVRPLSQVHTP